MKIISLRHSKNPKAGIVVYAKVQSRSKPKRLTRAYVITFTGIRQEIPSSMISPNTFFRRSDAVAALQLYIIQHGGWNAYGWSNYHIRTFSLVGSQR